MLRAPRSRQPLRSHAIVGTRCCRVRQGIRTARLQPRLPHMRTQPCTKWVRRRAREHCSTRLRSPTQTWSVAKRPHACMKLATRPAQRFLLFHHPIETSSPLSRSHFSVPPLPCVVSPQPKSILPNPRAHALGRGGALSPREPEVKTASPVGAAVQTAQPPAGQAQRREQGSGARS